MRSDSKETVRATNRINGDWFAQYRRICSPASTAPKLAARRNRQRPRNLSVLPGGRAVVRLAYVVGVAARAVLVTPLLGPLAGFGKAGASALALWADRSGVSLEVIDAYPSAASAIRAAEPRRPDVVFPTLRRT